GQTAAYIASARRTVAEGTFLGATSNEGAMSYLFARSVAGPGGVVTKLETRVIVRENWALIATHGKPLGGG
ncbi:hypothetical protein, partial [Microlunatus ginsengisoli]|uniref:hypothetical protein n=1 Tax=Microlunatus ginsengisoli TaxID=363863 RepID=UPI0031DD9C50